MSVVLPQPAPPRMTGEAAVQRQIDRLALLLAEKYVPGAELLRDLHDRQSRVFKDVSELLRRSHLIFPCPLSIQMTPLLMEEGGLQQERFIHVELLFGEVRSHRLADAEQALIRAVLCHWGYVSERLAGQ